MLYQQDRVHSLQEVAKRLHRIQVKEQAIVAGFLLDESGKVVYQYNSSVIKRLASGNLFLQNPTDHSERKCISWYCQNKQKLSLPPPGRLTIVSTLDPCLMCASCIVISGFNVGTISLDNYAGVNYKQNAFEDFSFSIFFRSALLNQFGYYKISEVEQRANYLYDAPKVVFKEQQVSKQSENKVFAYFIDNIGIFRQVIGHNSLPLNEQANLRGLPQNNQLKANIKTLYPKALSIYLSEKVKVNGIQTNFYQPSQELRDILAKLVQENPLARNSLALIDGFGNLILARSDRFDVSPINSAIFNVVSDYSSFRFRQIDCQKDVYESEAYRCLPSLCDCTFIFLNALPNDDPISLQTVGIYGSSVQNYVPKGGLLYINDYLDPGLSLQSIICNLPPLYRQHIAPMRATLSQNHQDSSQDKQKKPT